MPTPILALIPAYNEVDGIAQVVRQTQKHLPVLVVDDGSSDDTAARAESAGAVLLRQRPNQGKGVALRAGFQTALAQGYKAVITLDGDGQHDPAEIPAFLERYRTTEADLIIGRRDFGLMPPIRRLANSLGRWSFSWAIGQPVPDNQSGYRLISRQLMAQLLASHESGFEFEVEMIVTCIQHDFRLAWVPIQTIYLGEQSHIRPWQHTLNFVRLIWHTRRRLRQAD